MSVTQTPVETLRRIDISVAPAEAAKTVSIASVTGFYGTAISPGVEPVPWAGDAVAGGNPNNPNNPNNSNSPGRGNPPPTEDPPAPKNGETLGE
jgi:hypothetical protein